MDRVKRLVSYIETLGPDNLTTQTYRKEAIEIIQELEEKLKKYEKALQEVADSIVGTI